MLGAQIKCVCNPRWHGVAQRITGGLVPHAWDKETHALHLGHCLRMHKFILFDFYTARITRVLETIKAVKQVSSQFWSSYPKRWHPGNTLQFPYHQHIPGLSGPQMFIFPLTRCFRDFLVPIWRWHPRSRSAILTSGTLIAHE